MNECIDCGLSHIESICVRCGKLPRCDWSGHPKELCKRCYEYLDYKRRMFEEQNKEIKYDY